MRVRNTGQMPFSDVILFLVLCQSLKRRSWTWKGWQSKGALGHPENIKGFLSRGACVCMHMDVCTWKPAFCSPQCSCIQYKPISRSYWCLWPQSSFAPSENAGRLWVRWGPCPQLFCASAVSQAGKCRRALVLPVPYWGRMSPATSPLHSPSPLWKLCLSYQ